MKRVKNLLAFAYDPIAFLQQLVDDARQSGKNADIISFYLLHQQCYYIGDPNFIKQFFARPDIFRKDSIDFYVFQQTLGRGLLVSQDDLWQNQRRLMQPMFSRKQALACAPMIVNATYEMCQQWTKGTIDVWEECKHLTLRIVGEALFSRNPNKDAIGEHFIALERYIVELFRVPIPLPKWIPIPANRRLVRAQKELYTIITTMKRERSTGIDAREDLLSRLIEAQSDESGSMTDQQLQDEIITLLFAGHETTAAALVWCCYALASYQNAASHLYQEIDQILGDRLPTAADLPNLNYTRWFVEETLRLWPPACFTNRMVKQDTQLGPYHLKKNSLCFVSSLVMQRDEKYYPNPEHFQPEHFAAQTVRPTYTYFPFGGGPHVCIGSQFAITELTLALATIAQQCSFECLTDEPIISRMQPSLRPVKLELTTKVRHR